MRFSDVCRHYDPDLLRWNSSGHQVSHAYQVVGGARERKDPIHLQRSAMPNLAQECNRLQPAKAFFDALPFLLADAIALVLRGAPINRAAASSRQVLRQG